MNNEVSMSSQSRKLGLAVAQMGPVHLADDRAKVVARLLEMMREAKSRQADLVVFPEMALTTFFPRYWMSEEEAVERFFERSMPNADVQPLFDAARELSIGFYLGYAEITPEGRRFNTSILVDKSAKIVRKYRKIHLPGHADHKVTAPFQHLEKKFFEVGDLGFTVSDMLGAKIGMCLCNDRRWPETWRTLSLQSAEVGVVGYNTPSWNIHWNEPPHLRMHTHLISLQASAYQNAMWIGASAKCGSEDGFHMIGGSVIVAPSGEIVAQSSGEEDEVIFSNINLALGDTFREHVFNFAKHRRPEHYTLICERVAAGEPLPDRE
jgi:predicted amidohydrolase